MFSQKEIAVAFGITPQAVTLGLRGCQPEIKEVVQHEGRRTVRRRIRTYQPRDVFALAVRSGKLVHYDEMCRSAGIEAEVFHVTRKEVEFAGTLRRFLPEDVEIVLQHRVGAYRLDFYLPAYGIGIEYDERHHRNGEQAARDLDRERSIEATAGIKLIRVLEEDWERGLFVIAQTIAASPRR